MQLTVPYFRLIASAMTACLASTVAAQDEATDILLFDRQQTMQVRIEAPLLTLRRDRSEKASQDGQFHYVDVSGAEQSLDVKVRPRGRFRRKHDICDFPPLRLNFRKKQVQGTEFHGQNKLKLVTHCDNYEKSYEQNLLQEYVAYRILNQLTDRSFRVRLLHVDYVDSGNGKLFRSKYAFLIEDEKKLGERLGLQLAEVKKITFEQLDPAQTALLFVFQYMIGNTDFSATRGPSDTWCCHNVIPYVGVHGQFIPVPYDFDFSGLVNAPYAAPRPGLRIDTVTKRQYRGPCSSNALLPDTLAFIASHRSAIDEIVNGQEGFTKSARYPALRFLNRFYDDMAKPKKVNRYLVKECL
jgi:hypothetical protein